ncbi:two-component system response regulator YesN [Paenibacillus phyllosphaerae]|uniref:Two-component system response regulator YesN n=1 Tax=Paenibacillus phyllosphaerae TaxID=274593 RepID=A0A7W5AWS7_9BACL|nr:response regulator [Paenibacillus phyllosphaerae]MBB3109536.1 two-component system response regulator YesN [Paenibacillus phyllosphaerae]
MNILLVDDEAVDLEWLRRRVAGSGLNLNVVGTANSGFAALELLESTHVDIILSDIRMPIMTGIQFARKVKEIYPHIQIVFISGHEDFGYAKEALQINAAGYLLKPVDDEELYQQLASLSTKLQREREKDRSFSEALSLVSQELLLRWFHDIDPQQVEPHIRDHLTPLLVVGAAVAIIEIDDLEWRVTDEERQQMILDIEGLIKAYGENNRLGTLLMNRSIRVVVLSALPEDSFTARLEELIHTIRHTSPLTITIGIGKYTHEIGQLHESYRQAQAALSAKWLLGKNRIIREAADSGAKPAFVASYDEIVGRMLQAILEYDLVTIDDCLMQLFQRDVYVTRKSDIYDLIIRITSKLHADLQRQDENLYELLRWESQQPEVLFQFETMGDVLSWLRRRFFELSELLYVKKQRQKRKIIEEIIKYVEDNLEQRITLKEVAAHFDFTPNYLGHLFKEETGTHFSDFLNDARMKRICELLMNPTLKIYEIAERVGYKNIIYFNRQFKQSTGMSPGEYRKKYKV